MRAWVRGRPLLDGESVPASPIREFLPGEEVVVIRRTLLLAQPGGLLQQLLGAVIEVSVHIGKRSTHRLPHGELERLVQREADVLAVDRPVDTIGNDPLADILTGAAA